MPVIVDQRDPGVGTSAGAIQGPQNGPKTWDTKILKWNPGPLVFYSAHCLFFTSLDTLYFTSLKLSINLFIRLT